MKDNIAFLESRALHFKLTGVVQIKLSRDFFNFSEKTICMRLVLKYLFGKSFINSVQFCGKDFHLA